MKTVVRFLSSVLFLSFVTAIPLLAVDEGWIGMGLDVKLGGPSMLNLVVVTVTVKSIAPNSPADGQKITVGDAVIAVDGMEVSGVKLSVLKAKLRPPVGTTASLKLKRPGGEIYAVDLISVPKPK